MTLIKCPSCAHTISSVASKCPQCGHFLTQPRFQQGQEGALSACRKCGRKVLSKSRVCPYCGQPAPARRPAVAAVVALALVGAVLLVVAVQRRDGSGASVSDSTLALPTMPDAAPVATPVVVDSVAPSSSLPPAQPAPPPVAVESAVAAPDSADSAGLVPTETRWISAWANIREAPSLDAPVVRVIGPGRPVQVANRVQGWWEVYEKGRLIGYIAGSLLLTEPPPPPP